MAYIILNGVSSNTVNGLLIQTLPPISKPKKRTSAEEIDGRDGDIINVLGYAAYDKTFSIGLKGDYNVDDVIKYFDTSGEVIFSNESDKYYKYAIYNQIDFSKLIRFKTANVTLHVQPFKYSTDEAAITWDNPGSETIATIPVRNNGNINSKPTMTITGSGTLYVYLNSTQVFKIDLSSAGETIIIDVNGMNATDESGNYLNRIVTGDYNNLTFNPGVTNLRITGNVTSVTIDKYSRWI